MRRENSRRRERMTEGFWADLTGTDNDTVSNLSSLRMGGNRAGLGRSVNPRAVGGQVASIFKSAGDKAPLQQKRDTAFLADYIVGTLASLPPNKFQSVITAILRKFASEFAKMQTKQEAAAAKPLKTDGVIRGGGVVTEATLRKAIRSDLLAERKMLQEQALGDLLKDLVVAFADVLKSGKIPDDLVQKGMITRNAKATLDKTTDVVTKTLRQAGIDNKNAQDIDKLIVALYTHAIVSDDIDKSAVTKQLVNRFFEMTFNGVKMMLALKAKKEEEEKKKAGKETNAGTEGGEGKNEEQGKPPAGGAKPTATPGATT